MDNQLGERTKHCFADSEIFIKKYLINFVKSKEKILLEIGRKFHFSKSNSKPILVFALFLQK